MSYKIIQNASKCIQCNSYIKSTTVHDYTTCSCGQTVRDGGNDYIRGSGGPEESLTLTTMSSFEEVISKMAYKGGKEYCELVKDMNLKDLSILYDYIITNFTLDFRMDSWIFRVINYWYKTKLIEE